MVYCPLWEKGRFFLHIYEPTSKTQGKNMENMSECHVVHLLEGPRFKWMKSGFPLTAHNCSHMTCRLINVWGSRNKWEGPAEEKIWSLSVWQLHQGNTSHNLQAEPEGASCFLTAVCDLWRLSSLASVNKEKGFRVIGLAFRQPAAEDH